MPLILSGSAGLSGNVGTTTKEMLPAGSVLQVQQARKSDTWSTSSTGFQPISDMAVSMTPLNANSKFLVEVSLFVGAMWWSTNGGYLGLSINGASSPLLGNGAYQWALQYGADTGNSPYETMQWTDSALISPNSTAVQTFIPMLASYNASYAIWLNRSYNNNYNTQGRSTITVTEIKG